MLHVTTSKDPATALVKMDLRATGKTARVRFSGLHNQFWPFCKASSKVNS